jgi:hypothetical protein
MTNPAPGQQFRNDASQREREEVVRKDSLYSRAQSDLSLEQSGRHSKPTITTPEYPKLPASSPWAGDYAQVPPEPPLGFSIDEAPIVGEAFEIEKSLRDSPSRREGEAFQGATSASPSTSLAGDSVSPFADAPTPAASGVVEPPGHPNPKPWRRSL